MEIGSQQDLEAAARLRHLAKHTKLLARAKGPRLFGRSPIFALPVALAPAAAVLLMRTPLGVPGGAAVGILVFVVTAALLLIGDRVDALLELLLSSGLISPEPPALGNTSSAALDS